MKHRIIGIYVVIDMLLIGGPISLVWEVAGWAIAMFVYDFSFYWYYGFPRDSFLL